LLSRLAVLSLLLTVPAVAAATPSTVQHQGRLLDAAGGALQDVHTLHFSLYNGASGGAPVWSEDHAAVRLQDGYYTVTLGGTTPLETALAQGALFLTVALDSGPELLPRQPLSSVPWSNRAATADQVTGPVQWGQVTGIPTTSLAGLTCTGNQIAVQGRGGWVCQDHVHDAADLTTGQLTPARMPVPRTYVGTTAVPVSRWTGTPTTWTKVNDATATGWSFSQYNTYLATGQHLEARLCLSFTDSGDNTGATSIRVHNTTTNAVVYTQSYGNTWSGSGLVHQTCGTWVPTSDLASCGYGWGSTCDLQVNQSQQRAVTLYRLWWEISAI